MTVRPADRLRIRAADWNAVNLAARRMQSMPLAVGAPGGGPQMLATSPTTALARNIGEDTIPRYGAVICIAPVILPEDNEAEWAMRLAVDCKIPDTDDPWAWVAVATAPILPGMLGRVCVSGAVQAIVNITSADHHFAVAADGAEFLQSAAGGPVRILWRESGTGTKKAIVAVNAGVIAGAVASGQIVSATEAEDEATLGYQGYIVARHQNAAMDLFAASGAAIPCVNAFELSGDLQDQVTDSLPGGIVTLQRLPVGTLVGPIVQLPVPAEVGALWMFTQANAYEVTCP